MPDFGSIANSASAADRITSRLDVTCYYRLFHARSRRGVIAPRRVKSGGGGRPQAKLGGKTNLMHGVAFRSCPPPPSLSFVASRQREPDEFAFGIHQAAQRGSENDPGAVQIRQSKERH